VETLCVQRQQNVWWPAQPKTHLGFGQILRHADVRTRQFAAMFKRRLGADDLSWWHVF
jgi:hypothetical protein